MDLGRVISEPDKGLYDAMNKGLAAATGDYVCFLNAGDTFHENTSLAQIKTQIETQINAHLYSHRNLHEELHRDSQLRDFETTTDLPAIVYGETDIVDDAGNFIAHRRLKVLKKLNWRSFKQGMLVSHQAFFVLRKKAVQYDLKYKYSSDVDWCIRCMKANQHLPFLNTHLILIDYLSEGMTTQNRAASLRERFHIMCHYYGTSGTIVRHLWFAMRSFLPSLGRFLGRLPGRFLC